MANLIIKSSANDLVIQGSDESPAITVGATGTTTFAENATLSGTANALGTVTTMTLPTPSASAIYPEGHVLQVQGTNSNASWGPISHSNEWHISSIDVSITTLGTNSNFWVTGRFNCDNSTATTFGCGIGFKYYIAPTETNIMLAHQHEQYNETAIDMYMVAAHQNFLTSLNVAIGTVVVFRAYGKFNNSNGTSSLGTGRLGQQLTVMEVQS